ncbi:hypothetical protein ACFMBG_03460 [Leisingera sp. D0M16]|uniref:hypothetical protein n=1 Tax=Leisingera coralii TaxID=3351347 RepID=UPI003B79775D
MRKMIFAFLGLAALAACGVDGEPVQPTLNAGVGVGSGGGVHVGGALGLHQGPVSVYLGF